MADPQMIEMILMRAQTADEGELFRGIAKALPPEQTKQIIAAAAIKLKSPAAIGKEFYRKTLRPRLRVGICGKAKFCKNRQLYDKASALAGMVADNALEAIGKLKGFPPGSGAAAKLALEASAAVLKEGLNKLCECPESE